MTHSLNAAPVRRRFVILRHDHPFLHWDLLLEDGPLLAAWRLLQEPQSGRQVPAEPLPEHRTVYLDYEGPVSGDRGTVTRIAAGTFEDLPNLPNPATVRFLQLYDCSLARQLLLTRDTDGCLSCEFIS